MQTDAPLNRRAQEILHSVVKEYIETGEPVGSRTISKRRSEELSAASIRNVMADLADEGYLSQPHTSAGRVPTEKAFQHYVRYISAGRMPANVRIAADPSLLAPGTYTVRVGERGRARLATLPGVRPAKSGDEVLKVRNP